jgi:biotin transport system substrate-specific component
MTALAQSITRRENAQTSLMVDAIVVILGSLFVALLAQLSIKLPYTPVPVTGQTLGVLLVGGALGSMRGAASMALYLVWILVGLPFGAGGEGGADLLSLASVTGGYLWGFVIAGYVVGKLAEKGWDRNLGSAIGAFVIGEIIIFGLGVPWLAQAVGYSGEEALRDGFYPFVLGDLVKVLLAAAAIPTAWRFLRRDRDDQTEPQTS